uniref:Uncharacterized protein n=1 Tax=Arundo donax TaxID=35708 RepID=A0A0A9F378_ARUDO
MVMTLLHQTCFRKSHSRTTSCQIPTRGGSMIRQDLRLLNQIARNWSWTYRVSIP